MFLKRKRQGDKTVLQEIKKMDLLDQDSNRETISNMFKKLVDNVEDFKKEMEIN